MNFAFKASFLKIGLLIVGLGVIVFMQEKRPMRRLSETVVFGFNEKIPNYSADTLRFMSFGYSRMMSSLLWLRFLQHTPPERMDPDQFSWIYRDLEAVTEIDPDFYPAYEMGGVFLSVITEDKLGAELILKKGIERFPLRWRIHAYLAYHYLIELKQPQKAREFFISGSKIEGAPSILGIRAASLTSESGEREQGIAMLKEMLESARDPHLQERIKERIRKLEAK